MRSSIPLLLIVLAAMGSSVQAQPATFIDHGEILRTNGVVTALSNSPRPLQQALEAINEEYGWGVNYEDPIYHSTFDLAADSNPAWQAAHPGSHTARRIAGGKFRTQYQETPATAHSIEERGKVLSKVVADYNASSNPGKFVVRTAADGRFDVVGIGMRGNGGEEESYSPLLDTRVSIPAFSGDAMTAIKTILAAVTAKRQTKIALGMAPYNSLMQARITLSAAEAPARDLLAQVLSQTHRKLYWVAMYDPDGDTFAFNVAPVARVQYDTFGRRTRILAQ